MIRNFFLPQSKTHKKAHLISWYGLLCYVLIFILAQTLVNVVSNVRPGVLGINSEVNQSELIRLTNIEREKRGLGKLQENAKLDQAAAEKAKSMFAENYWAHYSPSGKDPWGFILGSGYRYSVAGENLARNFYKSDEVVAAWMESPTHRDNVLNPKYHDIGMAVVEGVLQGQKTILVVQEFGSEYSAVAKAPESQVATLAASQPGTSLLAAEKTAGSSGSMGEVLSFGSLPKFSVDPYLWAKLLGGGLLTMIGVLLLLDWYVLSRRGVVRLSSAHFPHLAMVGVGLGFLWSFSPGVIL